MIKTGQILGRGGYSTVYEAECKETKEKLAVKVFERHTDIFEREVTIMKKINCISEEQEFEGFPRLVQHGVLPNNKNYMIMSYNGNESTSLKQIFKSISGYNTILNLGQEVIKSLKVLHSLGLVHCDVKPSNILYTKNSDNPEKFTLIDFGISRRYLDQKNKHVLKQRLVNFSGSIEFIATDCLKKYHPTRKHDLEALLNTMIYLFTSQCSFGELNNSFASTKIRVIHQLENREKAIRIASKHRDSLATFLTKNIEINSCFTEFAEIILNMEYDEEPQYEALINLLEKCKESEVKVETACESSANQSKSSSLSQFLEFIRFSNKDEFSKSNKNSESKSDSAINRISSLIFLIKFCIKI